MPFSLNRLSTKKPKRQEATKLSSPQLLEFGKILYSPGGHFSYRIIGPCCRLFDREQLPWPCCRLEWHGKEPSWRRIGRRFVVDLATRQFPSYSVTLVGMENSMPPFVITLYWKKLSPQMQEWWYAPRRHQKRD